MSPRTVEVGRGAKRMPPERRFRALSFGEAVGFCAETYVEPLLLVADQEYESDHLDEFAPGPVNLTTAASSPSLYGRLASLLSCRGRLPQARR
jgi:hypothetical protein